ncbi:MAG: type II toxin-antitoxin system VapC family toxin [Caulobacteraceae bacterium]|nr:type II toxin-antitoxin system VapC family toxin [Caulobacteraceae bacterium]
MNLLLDSHAFLWWDEERGLARTALDLIADPSNRIYVSVASIWELAQKRRSGRLRFDGSIVGAIRRNGFAELAITGEDAEAAGNLDWAHRDPFDRMIVAQAQRRGFTLVTAERTMQAFIGVAQVAAT